MADHRALFAVILLMVAIPALIMGDQRVHGDDSPTVRTLALIPLVAAILLLLSWEFNV